MSCVLRVARCGLGNRKGEVMKSYKDLGNRSWVQCSEVQSLEVVGSQV